MQSNNKITVKEFRHREYLPELYVQSLAYLDALSSYLTQSIKQHLRQCQARENPEMSYFVIHDVTTIFRNIRLLKRTELAKKEVFTLLEKGHTFTSIKEAFKGAHRLRSALPSASQEHFMPQLFDCTKCFNDTK